MSNVTVVGIQWGDEGKGKIVDWLSERADAVVRFQGGHNAGHTLVIDGVTYKLSLLPSGIVRGKTSVIGNGVVVDPEAFLSEVARIRNQNIDITPEILKISEHASFILPLHRELDQFREQAAGNSKKIGTTGRGIGPAYEDKVARRAIRVCDLAEPQTLPDKVDRLLSHHNPLRIGLGVEEVDRAAVLSLLETISEEILSFAAPTWEILANAKAEDEKILFEGAQGTMLDNDYGTYPFVTSSNTSAAQAAIGSGAGPDMIGFVLGIAKAYTTRVGSGPFPTELFDEDGARMGERGHEFGTVTGRPRRCGWFDAVMVRQAALINGVSGLALMKLDVLDGMDEVKICTGYQLDGRNVSHFPASIDGQGRVEPVYESMPGWKDSTESVTEMDKLPQEAQDYIARIEELVGIPVVLVSTSPERSDTILLQDPFEPQS